MELGDLSRQRVTHTTVPAGPPNIVEPPLSPRTRALVVGVRAALLALADVLGEYAGLPKRG